MQKSEISSKRAFIEPSEFFFEKIFSFLSVKHTLVLRKNFFRALGAHSVEKNSFGWYFGQNRSDLVKKISAINLNGILFTY